MSNPKTQTVYQLDTQNCYIHTTQADPDPMQPENHLIPALCVTTAPPKTSENQAAQWQPETQTWSIIPDYRGKTAYHTQTRQPETITQVGELPGTLTLEAPPSSNHTWNGKTWTLDKQAAARIKATQQETAWNNIKAKRTTQTHGGVYVGSLKKWFHTDEASRTQYLQLQILAAQNKLPDNLQWKTMDNSFIPMTRDTLAALAAQILQNEQADFANAEKHRAAMLQAEKPLDYDYSGGWTEIYANAS